MATFQLRPRGTTREGLVLARLETPDGRRVELYEQWVDASGAETNTIWALGVAPGGERWWLDHGRLAELRQQAKGKRQPFPAEIPELGPPPLTAMCPVRNTR
jgi:hypothetical protein